MWHYTFVTWNHALESGCSCHLKNDMSYEKAQILKKVGPDSALGELNCVLEWQSFTYDL